MLVLIVVSGCSGMHEGPENRPDSAPEESSLTEWFRAYHIEIRDAQRLTREVALVSRQTSGDDQIHNVHVGDRRFGFILGDSETYRFTNNIDRESGERTQGIDFLGHLSIQGGVKRILGITGGQIELYPLTEPARSGTTTVGS